MASISTIINAVILSVVIQAINTFISSGEIRWIAYLSILSFLSIRQVLKLYPSNIWEKRKLSKNIAEAKVIAHRGSKLEGLPENTLAAFNGWHCLALSFILFKKVYHNVYF